MTAAGKPAVFIHTNAKQLLGALLGAYSMKRASTHADAFDVRLLRLEETPHLLKREGQRFLRKGRDAVWRNDDLQSFSPLRRMPPQLMGFEGRALVTDPDVFAVGDVFELLTTEMNGKAILCRHIAEGYQGNGSAFYASSVMLLDCTKLQHWTWDDDIDRMFRHELDYGPWISLASEDPATIGEIGESWNSFDKLTSETKLLHTTERSTQPWKTGLPVDYDTTVAPPKRGWLARLLGPAPSPAPVGRYQAHPDGNQETFVFTLLKEALEAGEIDEAFVRGCIERSELRSDAFALLDRVGYRGGAASSGRGRLIESYGLV